MSRRDDSCSLALCGAKAGSGRQVPLRRLEISFSQGAKWKALISKYIGTIPVSGDV
ncbi:hypothetical protein [Rhizobium gallicum]|uniref:hypothetical protein n=1 Tax=Rhizobium gallicum TaxID=56730 RepID=UPI003B8A857F